MNKERISYLSWAEGGEQTRDDDKMVGNVQWGGRSGHGFLLNQ